MTKNSFYKVVIAILVVLNLGTLALLWLGPPKEPVQLQGQAAGFLVRELGLSTAQQDEFGKLREEHHGKLMIIQEKDRKLHDRFFGALFLPVPDTSAVRILADSIADLKREIDLLTFDHFSRLRKLLSTGQQEKFHRVFRQALERAMPPPAPLSPPPPPPPADR
ncbi:MAG: hypothetical protein WCK34_09380 [Bacteroidota bacterium]